MWTLILLGGRHLPRRTVSLHLGRWTLWGPVLDGRPDTVRHAPPTDAPSPARAVGAIDSFDLGISRG